MKLIFLDIDGVICCNSFGRLEDKKLRILQGVCKETAAKVVLSTDWRRVPVLKQRLLATLRDYGIEAIGSTPCRPAWQAVRPMEIVSWLAAYHETAGSADRPYVTHFVAIDDRALLQETGGDGLQGHFVHTRVSVGITDRAAQRMKELLTQNEPNAARIPGVPNGAAATPPASPTKAAVDPAVVDLTASVAALKTKDATPPTTPPRTAGAPAPTTPTTTRRGARPGRLSPVSTLSSPASLARQAGAAPAELACAPCRSRAAADVAGSPLDGAPAVPALRAPRTRRPVGRRPGPPMAAPPGRSPIGWRGGPRRRRRWAPRSVVGRRAAARRPSDVCHATRPPRRLSSGVGSELHVSPLPARRNSAALCLRGPCLPDIPIAQVCSLGCVVALPLSRFLAIRLP